MKSVSHIILVVLLASGAAVAAEIEFDEHDNDGDGFLSQGEWQAIDQATVDFVRVDANRDGQLDRDEVRNATQQSMEVSASSESGSEGDDMSASVYTDADQQVEAERSRADDQAQVELSSERQVDAESESDDQASEQQAEVELSSGQQGEIQRASSDESVDEREPVRTEPLTQSESELTATEEVSDDEPVVQHTSGQPLSQQSSTQAQDQGDEENRDDSSEPMDVSGTQSEVAPMRAGFDAAGEGQQAFDEADTDSDGRLSESEARLAGHDYVAIYFEQMDVDGDGYLHQEEWDLTQREGMDTQNVSSEESLETMQGDDGEDLRYEGISHERVGEDEEEPQEQDEDETDFEQ